MSLKKTILFSTLAVLIAIIGLVFFYSYMIYGIHPSDEGNISTSCEYDTIKKEFTSIKIITIRNGKRVITEGTEADCSNLNFNN